MNARNAQSLGGLKFLVTDDNPIMQRVAEALLTSAGATVSLAADGRAAVAALDRQAHFDAILMDLEMPEMDGFEASRQIRAARGSAAPPIIAMTAHDPASIGEALAEAGFCAALKKPLEPDLVMRTLARWCGIEDGEHEPDNDAPSGDDAPDLPDSVPGIAVRAGLRYASNNVALYIGLLRQFADTLEAHLDVVNRHIDEGALEPARMAVHALRGTAGTLGVRTLAMQLSLLENLLSAADIVGVRGCLADVDASAREVLESATSLVEEFEPRVSGTGLNSLAGASVDELTPFLQDLLTQCAEHNLAALKTLRAMIEQLALDTSDPSLSQLVGELEGIRFQSAAACIMRIAVACGIELNDDGV